MKSNKTIGIILRRINLGEADRILTVLTKNHGKIRVVAKGIRKTLSKLAGHLEPFCLTELMVTEGKSLNIITSAQVKETYINLRSNLESTRKAYFLAEVIDKIVDENHPHEEIFDLLKKTLESINSGSNELMQSYFEINLLAELGFKPELEHCLDCHGKLDPQKVLFNAEQGGLTCGKCSGGREISEKAIKVLRLFLAYNISIIDRIKTDEKLTKEILYLTNIYLKTISQQEFKTERFLK